MLVDDVALAEWMTLTEWNTSMITEKLVNANTMSETCKDSRGTITAHLRECTSTPVSACAKIACTQDPGTWYRVALGAEEELARRVSVNCWPG